jgi:hypothetical protein
MGNLLGLNSATRHLLGQLLELFANRVAGVFGTPPGKVADGRLRAVALSRDLRLTPSGGLNAGDKCGPIHAPEYIGFPLFAIEEIR